MARQKNKTPKGITQLRGVRIIALIGSLLGAVALLFAAIFIQSSKPLIAETNSWPFDNAANYITSSGDAEVSSGKAQLTAQYPLSDYDYRQKVTISNPNTNPLTEYQIELEIDSSNTDFWNNVKSDCSDVAITDTDETTELNFYRYECIDNTSFKAYVQVPSLAASATHDIYVHYGNAAATDKSDIEATFEYTTEQTVAYIGGDNLAAQTLNIVSLEDGNTIDNGTSSQNLDEQDTGTFPAGELNIGTAIKAKKLFHGTGDGDGSDMITPASWAGTEFTAYRDRDTKFVTMFSPFGNASVTVRRNGTPVAGWNPGALNASGTTVNLTSLGFADNDVMTIGSDIPIYAYHYATAPSPGDSTPLYPSTADTVYGASHSNYIQIAAGDEAVSVTWNMSNGEAGNTNLGAYGGYEQSSFTDTLDSQGWGPAVRITTDKPIHVNQMADSDGRETVGYLPYKELGTKFGANYEAQNILIAAPNPSTECTVTNSAAATPANPASGYNNPHTGAGSAIVNKIFFGYPGGPGSTSANTQKWLDPGWKVECDKPVYAYFEKEDGGAGEPSDESHLASYPQMRQFTYPTPAVSTFGSQETVYVDSLPTVENKTGATFSSLTGFTEMLGAGNEGSVTYQISNNGSDWYYHNGLNWIAAVNNTTTNTATQVNTEIDSFDDDIGTGDFFFKAFLVSNGTQQVELDTVSISFIADSIEVTSPTNTSSFNVGDNGTMQWSYAGNVGTTVNITADNGDGNGFDYEITSSAPMGDGGSGTFTWQNIPESEQSESARIKVCSNDFPILCNTSDQFKIYPGLTITSPNGGETFGAGSARDITWNSNGTVSQISLFYSIDSGANWTPISECTGVADSGSCTWTVPNANNIETTRVKIEDASNENIVDTSDADFGIDYYTITWNVTDKKTAENLTNLTVSDSNGSSDLGVNSPVIREYTFGTYTTNWSKNNYEDGSDQNWTIPDATVLAYERNIGLERITTAGDNFVSLADFLYNVSDNKLTVDTWLQNNGALVSNLVNPKATVTLYDSSNNKVITLESTTPSSQGVFTIEWNDTTLKENELYFAEVTIQHDGNTYTAGTTYEIDIALQIEQTKTIELQIESLSSKIDELQKNQDANTATINALKSDVSSLLSKIDAVQINTQTILSQTSGTLSQSDINNIATELQALLGIARSVETGDLNRPTVEVYYTDGSVIANILLINPTEEEVTLPVKVYLPEEATRDTIKDVQDLDLQFDPRENAYFVEGKEKLLPNQTLVRRVRMEDVWQISTEKLSNLQSRSASYVDELAITPFSSDGKAIEGQVTNAINEINLAQIDQTRTPDERIASYREYQKKIAKAEEDVQTLYSLSTEAQSFKQVRLMILGALFILLALILLQYRIWLNQRMIVTKLRSAKNEKINPEKQSKKPTKKKSPKKSAGKKKTKKKSTAKAKPRSKKK